jgi:hypothetical protein
LVAKDIIPFACLNEIKEQTYFTLDPSRVFRQTKIPMGNFQACDALSILFKFEKLPIEHLQGFFFLLKEGGELQNFFRTFH